MNDYWCIPPKENAEFVANMEDILDIYEMPYNPEIPVVCMDEKPYQCLGETRTPLPMRNIINLRLDITHLYYPAKNSFQKGRLKRREIFTELLLYTLTT